LSYLLVDERLRLRAVGSLTSPWVEDDHPEIALRHQLRDLLDGGMHTASISVLDAFRESGSLRGRFCPIPLYPVAGTQLSKAMPIYNSEAFWNTNLEFFFHEDGIPLSLEPDTEPEPGYYKKQVKKVAHQLRQRLDEIKNGSRDLASKGTFSGRIVLLARKEPVSSVEKEWQNIQNLLVNDGATVIPDIESESKAAKFEAELEAAVQRADLFVQLFSTSDQLDRAKAQLKAVEAGRPIPILQWRKKHPNPKTDLAILESLNEGDRKFCEGAKVQTGLLRRFQIADSRRA
jgi:hypothetical protein